jgi:hypothetical protein
MDVIPDNSIFWHGNSKNETKPYTMNKVDKVPLLGLHPKLTDFNLSRKDTTAIKMGTRLLLAEQKRVASFY